MGSFVTFAQSTVGSFVTFLHESVGSFVTFAQSTVGSFVTFLTEKAAVAPWSAAHNVVRPQNSVISVISLQALDFSGVAIFLEGQTLAAISCRDWTSACRYFFRIILLVIAIRRTLRFFRPMARIGMWPHGGPRSNAPIARYHRMQAEGSPQAIFFTCRLRDHTNCRDLSPPRTRRWHERSEDCTLVARAIFERPVVILPSAPYSDARVCGHRLERQVPPEHKKSLALLNALPGTPQPRSLA